MSSVHDAIRESLGALALGMLDDEEQRAILHHADACPECSAELDDFLELAALLRPATTPAAEPAPVGEPIA
jgi:anti-sigma factor RsiW